MKVTIITREFPPNVYGGAGVHVKFLTRELAKHMQVDVRCFGEQDIPEGSLRVKGYNTWERMWEGDELKFNSVLGTFSVALSMVRDRMDSNLVHTHTWYAALAGYLAKSLYGIPLVCTVHSLEPLRPWKEEQLGRSYGLSAWAEKIALENADRVIAVSKHSKEDVLKLFDVKPEKVAVIHNGIDLDLYRPLQTDGTRQAFDIGKDYVLFVGRVSRQKGIEHLINAVQYIDDGVQCVCCTSAPDTKEFEEEIAAKIARQPRASSGSTPCCARNNTWSFTATPGFLPAPRCTSRLASSTWSPWRARPRWWRAAWAASWRRWWMARRACWSSRPSPRPWQRPSTGCSGTGSLQSGSGRTAASASRSTSPGRASRSGPRSSTRKSSESGRADQELRFQCLFTRIKSVWSIFVSL